MRQRFQLSFRLGLFILCLCRLGISDTPTEPILNPTQPFHWLKEKSRIISEKNTTEGWAYIISGGIVLGITIPGYYLSEDVFAGAVYSLGQTVAVTAIGYGTYLVLTKDDTTRFLRILESDPSLTETQKNNLSKEFLLQNAAREKGVRKLRIVTHSLMAGLNVLNGLTADNTDLRTALFFLGGVNTLAALNFILYQSEEEKIADHLQTVQLSIDSELRLTYKF